MGEFLFQTSYKIIEPNLVINMHFAITTYGSRGDVQPFVSLALGLMDNGHQVTLLAPGNFKEFVNGYGVNFYALHGNIEEIVHSPEGLRVLKTGNTFSLLRYMQKAVRKLQPVINNDILSGCADADVIISSVLCIQWVKAIAEKLNKSWGVIQFQPPTSPTKAFPFVGLNFFNFPNYNLFTYWLLGVINWSLNKREINKFRISLGLKSLKRPTFGSLRSENILNLYCFSQLLIKRPDDWPSNTHITGFMTLADRKTTYVLRQVDEILLRWIEDGEKPVYIGFGSIPIPDPELFSAILIEIIQKNNIRVVLCKGWTILPGIPSHPNLFVLDSVNHEWLLPKCSSAIIHGGAGTLAAVLNAQIPLVIISVFGDQPWWGSIIENKRLGIHIPFKQITTAKILDALYIIQTDEYLNNTRKMGDEIQLENGLQHTVKMLEDYFVAQSL
ncbi:glycosyltransferase [Mucilaginibacter sabulilitoris]|uniref:Glycosyltransferase n=1 Tax=Mucilaginibacter sabulilitoris TaxID=1173583 RepID=A0ABZ0THN0_9SPHI|nr:glycosyltransferase [Mucilaginibacter sabulilitoris]WPU92684.1 glycosyltransferase [Mucilaginibacter sabulilitoris]